MNIFVFGKTGIISVFALITLMIRWLAGEFLLQHPDATLWLVNKQNSIDQIPDEYGGGDVMKKVLDP